MRFFVMIACVVAFGVAKTLPQAAKPYDKDESPKVEISGEILLRYEKQSTKGDTLKRAPKGSHGSLNLSIE